MEFYFVLGLYLEKNAEKFKYFTFLYGSSTETLLRFLFSGMFKCDLKKIY